MKSVFYYPRTILVSLLVLFFIYHSLFNILFIIPFNYPQISGIKIRQTPYILWLDITPLKISLPITKFTHYFLEGAGVFANAPHNSIEYKLYGLRQRDNTWVELPIESFFPYRSKGVQVARLSLLWHPFLGPSAQRTAYQQMGEKIKNRFNQQHPDSPIYKISLVMLFWPRSIQGYEALRTPQNEQRAVIYQDQ